MDHSKLPQVDEATPLIQTAEPPVCGTSERLTDNTQKSSKCTRRRYVVFVVLFCYFLAAGIFTSECPQYTQYRMIEKYKDAGNISISQARNKSICNVNKTSPSYELFTQIQQETARWCMYYPMSSKIPALVANIIWASYSDVRGRRFVFIACLTGATIRMCLFSAVVMFDLSLVFIVVGGVIDGVTGSFTTMFAVMFSYISDVTLPGKQRTVMIVLCELIHSVSLTTSAVTSGYLISRVGFLFPAFVCVGIDAIGLLTTIFLLPETRLRGEETIAKSPEAEVKFISGLKSVFRMVSETAMFYIKRGPNNQRLKYILLILGLLFFGMPGLNRGPMETVYFLGRPFCWTSTKIGWFHAIKTAISAVCSMTITYAFRKRIADDTIATFSVVMVGVSYIVEGVADNEYVLYSVPVLTSVSTLPIPMIRSLMSSLTSPHKQGALYAGVGFVESLCTLIGAVSNNTVYSATLTLHNGFVFFMMALLTFTSAAILSVFMKVNRKHGTQENKDDAHDEDDADITGHNDTQ